MRGIELYYILPTFLLIVLEKKLMASKSNFLDDLNWHKYDLLGVGILCTIPLIISCKTGNWCLLDVGSFWDIPPRFSVGFQIITLIIGYAIIKRYLPDVAPFWDIYDSAFAGIVTVILISGYVMFAETNSASPMVSAWPKFIKNSGLIALITAWTAIIGLYRLRHRPDKNRPSVRQDFNNLDEEAPTDFGLRNFGPGSALYVQAVVTIERKDKEPKQVTCFQARESPIHLREGDFASLVLDAEDDWVSNMPKKYENDLSEDDTNSDQENPPMVNLYFSYVSQFGARTPTDISTERDDECILDEIVDPSSKARRIELSRVVKECSIDFPVENSQSRQKASHR